MLSSLPLHKALFSCHSRPPHSSQSQHLSVRPLQYSKAALPQWLCRPHIAALSSQTRFLESTLVPQMFKDAQRPPWWPLELKWNKSQLDRATDKLVQIYGAAQERWQIMQKALQQRQAL